MMQIPSDQIAYKKKVGRLEGDPVVEIGLVGGFHMIVRARASGRVETLGTGPHRAVAQAIAKKRNPDLEWSELSKSDYIPLEHFEFIMPMFEELTDRFNAISEE